MTSEPLTDDLIARLRALAEKATPGPWHSASSSVSDFNGGSMTMEWIANGQYIEGDPEEYVNKRVEDDAAFMGAANPQTILSLLDALEESRAALKAVKAEVESGAILACEDLVLAALPVNGTQEIDHG